MKVGETKKIRFWLILLIFPIFVFIVLYRFYSPAQIPTDESQYALLGLDDEGISMKYPSDWQAVTWNFKDQPHGEVALIVPLGSRSPRISISKTIIYATNFDELMMWGVSEAMENTTYSEINEYSTTLDDQSAKSLEYSFFTNTLMGKSTMVCKDLYVLADSIGYQFSFCSDQNQLSGYKDVFEYMIQSIHFNPKP